MIEAIEPAQGITAATNEVCESTNLPLGRLQTPGSACGSRLSLRKRTKSTLGTFSCAKRSRNAGEFITCQQLS
jgi:hypothetical protein